MSRPGVSCGLWLALLLSWCVGGCWFDGELKRDLGTVPERLDDGWEIASPESVGLSSEALGAVHRELLSEDRFFGSLGMLVVKDGKLVWETYLRRRADRDHYQHVQSVTKSVTALVFGLAGGDGRAPSTRTPLSQLFGAELEGLEPAKRSIELGHLLSMRSGLYFEGDFPLQMWVHAPSDPVRYMLEKPLYTAPGSRFRYQDSDPQLVGHAIERLTGQTQAELALRGLFEPLGIENYYWQHSATGSTMAPHGLHLVPRDLAKLGLLVLQRGVFRGQQLLDPEWVEAVLTPRGDSAVLDGSGRAYPYGYFWWIVPDLGAAAWGHGGQFVLVVPEHAMVVVHVALPDAALHGSTLNDFLPLVRRIIP